jgi:sigma-B regulation protein RsbU (phosphoserine phosphatase)
VVRHVVEEPFDRLASLARDLLRVDWAFVTVVDDELSRWVGYAGEPLPPGSARAVPVEVSFCHFVVQDRQPMVLDDVREEPRTATSPLISQMGLLAWAGWPVISPSGEVLGSMCLACREPREWTVLDVRVLRTLAMAASTEFGLRMRVAQSERDLADAREDRDTAHLLATQAIQQAQSTQVSVEGLQHELVRELPAGGGLDLGAEYRPAGGRQLGSDWYDAIRHPDGSTTLVVGEVADVGAAPLATMSQVRDMIRTLAYDRPASPADVLGRVERIMAGLGVAGTVSCTLAHLGAPDPSTRRRSLCWTTAGSPPLLLREPGGDVRVLDQPADLALGVSGAVRRVNHEAVVDDGSAVVLFTHGVVEGVGDGRAEGLRRLAALLRRVQNRSARDTAGLLVEQSHAPSSDDVTVLVARTTGEEAASLTLVRDRTDGQG